MTNIEKKSLFIPHIQLKLLQRNKLLIRDVANRMWENFNILGQYIGCKSKIIE